MVSHELVFGQSCKMAYALYLLSRFGNAQELKFFYKTLFTGNSILDKHSISHLDMEIEPEAEYLYSLGPLKKNCVEK